MRLIGYWEGDAEKRKTGIPSKETEEMEEKGEEALQRGSFKSCS